MLMLCNQNYCLQVSCGGNNLAIGRRGVLCCVPLNNGHPRNSNQHDDYRNVTGIDFVGSINGKPINELKPCPECAECAEVS